MVSPAGRSPKESFDGSLAGDKLALKSTVRSRSRREKNIHDDVEELIDLGFSMRMIANLLRVNLTEVMRWRSTAIARKEEEKRMDELLAFCDMLETRYLVSAPATWFERWLVNECVIDMQEVYYNGHMDLVLNFAAKRITAEEVLDAYDPKWREVPPSMWEVASGPDGPYIRMKGDGDA